MRASVVMGQFNQFPIQIVNVNVTELICSDTRSHKNRGVSLLFTESSCRVKESGWTHLIAYYDYLSVVWIISFPLQILHTIKGSILNAQQNTIHLFTNTYLCSTNLYLSSEINHLYRFVLHLHNANNNLLELEYP